MGDGLEQRVELGVVEVADVWIRARAGGLVGLGDGVGLGEPRFWAKAKMP